jgi:hypothetical protein
VTQVVEHLSSKHEALSSNSMAEKKKLNRTNNLSELKCLKYKWNVACSFTHLQLLDFAKGWLQSIFTIGRYGRLTPRGWMLLLLISGWWLPSCTKMGARYVFMWILQTEARDQEKNDLPLLTVSAYDRPSFLLGKYSIFLLSFPPQEVIYRETSFKYVAYSISLVVSKCWNVPSWWKERNAVYISDLDIHLV